MAQKQAFATTLTAILTRTRTVLDRTAVYVRAVIAPSPKLVEYKADEGVHFVVYPPEPEPYSGAGRWGEKVKRIVGVYIFTQSVGDAAGRDELALAKILNLEEAVVNAVMDGNRLSPLPIGITINWVPGGESIARVVPKDQGLIGTSLHFQVTYAVAVTTGPGPAA